MSRKPDLRGLAGCVLETDADFDEVYILGGLVSNGSLNANIVDIKGSVKIKGSLWANRLMIMGGIDIGEDVIIEMDIDIKGGVEVGGKIQARNIEAFGGLHAKEGIEASNMVVKGGAKCNNKIHVEGLIDIAGGLEAQGEILAAEISAIGGLAAEGRVKVVGPINVRGKVEVEGDIECDEFIFLISAPSFINGKLQANRIKIELDEHAKMESFLRVEEIVSPNKIEIDYVIAERVVCPKMKAGENTRISEPIDKDYDPDY